MGLTCAQLAGAGAQSETKIQTQTQTLGLLIDSEFVLVN
jgi:hypothetical protein